MSTQITSVVTPAFGSIAAEALYKEIYLRGSRFFYGIGGVSEWPTAGVPEEPEVTLDYELQVRKNLIYVKQLSPSDVSFMVKRYDWTSGVVYDHYNDNVSAANPTTNGKTSLADSNFYVLTDANNVYKCLFNGYGAPSTVKPTGTPIEPFETADGYIWKFMYTLPVSLQNKFLTSLYMPVSTVLSANFYSNGAIDDVIIDNQGTGYVSGSTGVVVTGDGTGAVLEAVVSDGGITSVVVISPGSGYTYATISFTGAGTGARASVILSSGDVNTLQANVELLAVKGAIHVIEVENGGTGYTSATVTVTGDGTGCTATPTIIDGVLAKITVTNKGSNYTTATVTITGNGTGATARAIMSPIGGHGKNAIKEFYSRYLLFSSSINSDVVNDDTLTNDYRQVSLIKDILRYDSPFRFPDSIGSACAHVTTSSIPVGSFENDRLVEVVSNGKTLRVVTKEGNNIVLQEVDAYIPFVGDVLRDTTTSETVTVTTSEQPEIDAQSGTMLYINNRPGFSSSPVQTVTIKTLIKF